MKRMPTRLKIKIRKTNKNLAKAVEAVTNNSVVHTEKKLSLRKGQDLFSVPFCFFELLMG